MENSIEEELKKNTRRLDAIQKTVDLLFNDRTLLEDILARLSQVENTLHMNREHQQETQKDLTFEIQQVGAKTEDKVDEIKEKIDAKTVVVKSEKENILDKIIKKLKGGGTHESTTKNK